MGFLTPAFLVGLSAVAVPVLVHLTHRTRSQTVPFPSLMFLEQIPYRSVRRQRLRNWVLFLLRSSAVILLALAFARPFFGGVGRAASVVTGARVRVVLLDRSYSMGYGDRWTRATAAARHALTEGGTDDRVGLVLFDRSPQAMDAPTADRARLLADLASVAHPGPGVTRFAPALRLAREMIEAAGLPRREVVLITDFQKAGWEGAEDVRLPAGTTLTRVDVSDKDASNVAITGVDLQRDYDSGRERVIASARLVNKGTRPAATVPVSLEVDGRVVRQQQASLGPNASATVTFEPFPLPPSVARATVRLAPDALPEDDAFHFVLAPGSDLPVLVLEDGPSRGRSLYLERALAIGHRPRFRVQTKDVAQLRSDDLAPGLLVVLDDSVPTPAAARLLHDFVERGGGLLVVLGDPAAGPWPAEAASLLPGGLGPAVDRSADWGATLAYVDYGHPIFELFRGPHSGDFSSARFFRYRGLDAASGVLARFDDGAAALASRAIGKGRVLAWTSSIDTSRNDLALQPVFLPFLHQLVQYASGYAESPVSYTVGDALDLSRVARPGGGAVAILDPAGLRSPLAERASGVELTAPGFYELRPAAGGALLAVAAVNADRAESDLTTMDPEELAAAVTRADGGARGVRTGPALSTADEESRQALWRYVLMAALLLLAAETVLSNRLTAQARAGVRVP
jgi:Aerotolerance regulator N-terminal/von Willebrand factor type A domain